MQYLKNRVFNLIKRKLLDLWGNFTLKEKGQISTLSSLVIIESFVISNRSLISITKILRLFFDCTRQKTET